MKKRETNYEGDDSEVFRKKTFSKLNPLNVS